MISTPNRLKEVVASLEKSDPVDYGQVALLQMLDLAIAGRQAVEEAVQFQEEEDERIRELLQR